MESSPGSSTLHERVHHQIINMATGDGASTGSIDVEERARGFRKQVPKVVVAVADFVAGDETQMNFSEGDELSILSEETPDWWWGEMNGFCGYVPATYVVTETDYAKYHTHRHEWQDEEYFGDYGKLKLHLEMLGDKPRTLAYRKAISRHREVFVGKTVLDVGCGTGILSLFCARDGDARKVYAVEGSADIGNLTSQIVAVNDLSDVISVVVGKIEEVELPEKVDVILSEWMGTFLVFEFMIDSVLFARDKWLKPEGVIWPSSAKLFIAPCSAKETYDENVTVWKSQYGFDFSPLMDKAKTEFLDRPLYNHELDLNNCLSESAVLLDIDMETFPRENLELMSGQFEFIIRKGGTFHGLGSWFMVIFGGVPVPDNSEYELLSTSPHHERTHWKQNLFLLDDPVSVNPGNFITGFATLKRNPKYRRHLSVTFHFKIFPSKSNGSILHNIKKRFLIWR